jgi:hypothetical protein
MIKDIHTYTYIYVCIYISEKSEYFGEFGVCIYIYTYIYLYIYLVELIVMKNMFIAMLELDHP